MQKQPRRWVLPPRNEQLEFDLAGSLGVSLVTAQVLASRGFSDRESVLRFMDQDYTRLLTLGGMDDAVRRILEARREKQRVLVYGDYDVDGVTSTVLMQSVLREIGIGADRYIPDRLAEGYGLSRESILLASERGYNLIVTVDCGISSTIEVELAGSLGIDVVITDHHQPPAELPAAAAIINPKLDQTGEDLAGVGVAYHLACALLEAVGVPDRPRRARDYLDLVALGTVADVVALRGVNRRLVGEGLKVLAEAQRVGLQEMLRSTKLLGKEIEAWHIGFVLGPRLNAAGRMGNAEAAVKLLQTESLPEAAELVELLEVANQERQAWEKRILAEAEESIASTGLAAAPALVLMGESWHPGVLGIVASRLVEKYSRPAILFAREGERGSGSGRSVPGVNLIETLRECGSWLEEYGGHAQAAGMAIAAANLEGFAADFMKKVEALWSWEESGSELKIDAVASVVDLDCGLREELEGLKPYGPGNPAPLLLLEGAEVNRFQLLGSESEHLKLHLNGSGRSLEAIAFRQGGEVEAGTVAAGGRVDLAFHLEENTWQGRSRLQLKVLEMRPFRPVLPGLEEIKAVVERGECCFILQALPSWAEEFWDNYRASISAEGLRVAVVLSHQPPEQQRSFWKALHGEGLDLVLTTIDYLTYHVEKFNGRRQGIGLLLVESGPKDLGLPDPTGAIAGLGVPEVRDISYLRAVLTPGAGEAAWKANQWSFPQRDHLAEVFQYIRQHGGQQDWVVLDKRGIASWWSRRRPGENPDLDRLVPAALYIMEELSLASIRDGRAGLEVFLNRTESKADLNQSLRFREGMRLWSYHQGIQRGNQFAD
ncbi:MAG: single-stranded-DNA-specific exonuclease RecJ [Firmicutes bacterium]|nr:single-stranded-DNA-specific exonuclease RecJ [Bacillota bacterium]